MNEQNPILALQRQRFLLQMEYLAEKELFADRTEAYGLERRAMRGDAWLNVRLGRCYYNSLNQRVVEVLRTQDDDTDHNFEYAIMTRSPRRSSAKWPSPALYRLSTAAAWSSPLPNRPTLSPCRLSER